MDEVEQLKFEHKLFEAGRRLEYPPRSKDELLEALSKLETKLLLVEQAPSVSTLDALFPSLDYLISPDLMSNPDKDVMLLVISCLTQIIKITAPEEPYFEAEMREIFELIVGSFKELGEMNSPSFKRRFGILKTVGEINLCTVMLDLELDDLIIDMVKYLLSAVSQNNYSNDVYDSIKEIISGVLDESDYISEELLSVLLINMRKEMSDASPAAHSLCLDVVASCAEKLKPYFTAKISSNQENICNCVHGYDEIVYDICRHRNPEISANPGGNAEPVATSMDNANRQVSSSELVRDEKMSKKIGKQEADNKLEKSTGRRQGSPIKRSRVRENPRPTADSADKGYNGVGLTEGKAGEPKNSLSQPKSSNPSRPASKFPRKKSISETEKTVEAFGEDEKLIGRKVKVWWPLDKEFYEGVVESYNPRSKRHTILYFDGDGDREDLQLWKQRWEFIDHVPHSN